MREDLKALEKNLKRKHSIRVTPKFETSFSTKHSNIIFFLLVEKVFHALEWEVIASDGTTMVAHRKSKWDEWTEKIIVEYTGGNIRIKSKSLRKEIWDAGNNSLRVQLFIEAFHIIEKESDFETLKSKEDKIISSYNFENYVVPNSLPQPNFESSNFTPIAISGIITTICSAGLIAFLSVDIKYIFFIYEILAIVPLVFILNYSIEKNHFYDDNKIALFIAGLSVLFSASNIFFQYRILLLEKRISEAVLFQFIENPLNTELLIPALLLTLLGIFQIAIIYLVTNYFVQNHIRKITFHLIPQEVLVYANYLMHKGYNTDQITEELSQKGWCKKSEQRLIFKGIIYIGRLTNISNYT